MVNLCNSISPHINVIHLNINNLNTTTYSLLLADIKFWNLLHGTKILIYQEDSIIFKNNINDFIKWDYIGAPWPQHQNDTLTLVGNGGLSLRTKQCMIDVIHKQNINNISINSSTLINMKHGGLTICPEDVYFCKSMETYNIGKISDWNTASNFSTESILNLHSFGGHNFWLCDPEWKERIYKHNIIQFIIPSNVTDDFSEHRGGWATIKSNLYNQQLYNHSKYEFYDMLDLEFIFNKGHVITNKWCGIFHCTPITPSYLSFININKIFDNTNFLNSLSQCKGIITLSSYLSKYLKTKFKLLNINVKIYTLKHPVISNIPTFNYGHFINNKNKKLIQIGQQLRKVSSIYVLPTIENYSKLWLTGTKNYQKLIHFLNCEKETYHLTFDIHKVPMIYLKSYDEYDDLLTKNIVFIELFDASANNTIVECMIRNTPIVVNKIPGVVDYLGEHYPLYYHDLHEIPALLTEDNIAKTYQYLSNMNKVDLEINYFTKKLMTLLYKLFSKHFYYR
jgi:hypothetical protein